MKNLRHAVFFVEAGLVVAFLLHLSGWVIDYCEAMNLRQELGDAAVPLASILGRYLYDLAYAFFYLGEAMMIELIYRAYASYESSKTTT